MIADLLAVASGALVGFSLGLIGGGGSILATPLLIYAVGLPDPHLAIGTSALVVSVSAFGNLVSHARSGNVSWRSAAVFTGVGLLGALMGSTIGKHFDGDRLLFLFALLMIVVGFLMLRPRKVVEEAQAAANGRSNAKIAAVGGGVGILSGFFGIGGGFLIVPGLVFSARLPMIKAIGSSLLAVGSFGLATALNYALSGLIVWTVAGEYILGALIGGWIGTRLATRLAGYRNVLTRLFSAVIFIVAAYMLYRSGRAL